MANYYGSFTYGGTMNDYGAVTGYGGQPTPSASTPAYSTYQSSPAGGAHEHVVYGAYGAKLPAAPTSYEPSAAAYSSGYSASAYGGPSAPIDSYRSQGASGGYYKDTSNKPSYAHLTPSYAHSIPSSAPSRGSSYSSSSTYKATDWKSNSEGASSANRSASGTSGGGSNRTQTGGGGGSSGSTAAVGSEHSAVLDAAVYSAATSYLSERQGPRQTWKERFRSGGAPDQSQWKYCEICKCSCAGPQAYRMHLDGRAHKKKEQIVALASSGASAGVSGPAAGKITPAQAVSAHYFCQLCDVPCSSMDAYAAHMRGKSHQKVLKLQMRMGKPIPELDASPVIGAGSPLNKDPKIVQYGPGGVKTIIGAPKIAFVGGTQLHSTSTGVEEVRTASPTLVSEDSSQLIIGPVRPQADAMDDYYDKDIQPVGLEYIEESMNATRTAPMFHCKLCDCSFTDAQAKHMHSKGRRHRLSYKQKVDPSLKVDLKTTFSHGQLQKMRFRPTGVSEHWRRKEIQHMYRTEAEELRYEKELLRWQLHKTLGRYDVPQGMGGGGGGDGGSAVWLSAVQAQEVRPNAGDEKDLMAKHTEIYPSKEELEVVQTTISDCERALKLVSDFLAASDAPPSQPAADSKPQPAAAADAATKPQPAAADAAATTPQPAAAAVKPEPMDTSDSNAAEKATPPAATATPVPPAPPRAMKGVMRVGALAKGLLLGGGAELALEVVVLCAERPTRSLLDSILFALPKQLQTFAKTEYAVSLSPDGAHILMKRAAEPRTTCTIALTSPAVAAVAAAEPPQDPKAPGSAVARKIKPDPEILDLKMCLESLAALRRAKWFQGKAAGRPSCVVVIRILMEFCHRVPTWNPFSQWALELLVEKAVSSHLAAVGGGPPLTPAHAFMRVFELVASGILLDGGPGLYDPCERDATDVMAAMSAQEREDITNSAQHALRMIAFGQLRRVLNLQASPPPNPPAAPSAAALGGAVGADSPAATPPCKRQRTDA